MGNVFDILSSITKIIKNDSSFIMMMLDNRYSYIETDNNLGICRIPPSNSSEIISMFSSIYILIDGTVIVFYLSKGLYQGRDIEKAASVFLSKLKEELSGEGVL